MRVTLDDLGQAARSTEHAVDALLAAATLDRLPRLVRAQVGAALVATARVAGLLEALNEGFVTVQRAADDAGSFTHRGDRGEQHDQDQEHVEGEEVRQAEGEDGHVEGAGQGVGGRGTSTTLDAGEDEEEES